MWTSLPVLALSGLVLWPVEDGPTLCPFALLTGVACPGCGLTRAGAALIRGDALAAWELHPLIGVVALWLVGFWTAGLLRRRGRPVHPSGPTVSRLLNLTGVAFLVVWVIRMTMGTLPPV